MKEEDTGICLARLIPKVLLKPSGKVLITSQRTIRKTVAGLQKPQQLTRMGSRNAFVRL